MFFVLTSDHSQLRTEQRQAARGLENSSQRRLPTSSVNGIGQIGCPEHFYRNSTVLLRAFFVVEKKKLRKDARFQSSPILFF